MKVHIIEEIDTCDHLSSSAIIVAFEQDNPLIFHNLIEFYDKKIIYSLTL